MAVSAHDDQIGLSSIGLCHQFGHDLAGAALDAMKAGVNAMMPEMIDGVDAHHRLFFGRSFAGRDHDPNLFRLWQKRKSFGERPGRFPAAVPGNKDTVERDLRSLRLGNEKNSPARSKT